jgi:hypothetical protein
LAGRVGDDKPKALVGLFFHNFVLKSATDFAASFGKRKTSFVFLYLLLIWCSFTNLHEPILPQNCDFLARHAVKDGKNMKIRLLVF